MFLMFSMCRGVIWQTLGTRRLQWASTEGEDRRTPSGAAPLFPSSSTANANLSRMRNCVVNSCDGCETVHYLLICAVE
jgi:hypothetical protein